MPQYSRNISQVNKYLHQNGVPNDIQLVRGKGYFYFVGGNTPLWYDTSVYVFHLDELSLEDWLKEYKEKESKFHKRNETDKTKRMRKLSSNIWIIENVISTEMKNHLLEGLSEVENLCKILKEYDVSFCLLGGRSLPFYGYRRFTEDVDILVSDKDKDKLAKIPPGVLSDHSRIQPFRVWIMKDSSNNKTKVDMLFSSDKAGAGITFGDPQKISHDVNGIPVINLYDLIRVKISSGLSGNRDEDLKDVRELIKANDLSASYMKEEKVDKIKKGYAVQYKKAKLQQESFDKYFEI